MKALLKPNIMRRALSGVLVLALSLAVSVLWRTPAAGESERTTASPTGATSVPTNLPVVARPPAQQPNVGLPSDTHLDKTPPRATKGLDLVKSGWTYNCMECHKLFPARWHYDDRPFNEHKDIRLEHGNNRFCLNCHHPTNRNSFVDYDGAEITQADVVKLCAKCHGTIYRDWQAGVHGRQNGFWKAEFGDKTKLRCIQCHDPHSPKFKEMKPMAPLRYPERAAKGGGDASSPHGKRETLVAPPHAPAAVSAPASDEGVAATNGTQ
jgi:hypothetical protein